MFDKVRALVVGTPDTTTAVSQQLWVTGHIVLVAHSYETAKTLAENAKFDLVICDLDLHGDACEIINHLRATGRNPAAIALRSEGDETNSATRSCFNKVVVKPVHPQQMIGAVNSVLSDPQHD